MNPGSRPAVPSNLSDIKTKFSGLKVYVTMEKETNFESYRKAKAQIISP
jgi:hypothetical protein